MPEQYNYGNGLTSAGSQPDSIEFHRAEEWTAVYLNGKLERVGDHYLADEWLQERFGVKVVDDDACMQGGNYSADVAKTLDEVEAYRKAREDNKARAAELKAESDRLLAEANALDK